MNNFNAHGYSVPEVAQILGVTPCSVRHYINEGKLKADVSGEFRKGHKRRIRITKQQLADFMQSRKGYYESNPLYQKLVGSANDIAKKEEKIEENPFDSYAVKDISELSGACSPENLNKKDSPNKTKNIIFCLNRIAFALRSPCIKSLSCRYMQQPLHLIFLLFPARQI